jgi:hypothetical protein
MVFGFRDRDRDKDKDPSKSKKDKDKKEPKSKKGKEVALGDEAENKPDDGKLKIGAPFDVKLETYYAENRLNEFFYETPEAALQDCEARDKARYEERAKQDSSTYKLASRFVAIRDKARSAHRLVLRITIERDTWTRIKQSIRFGKRIILTHVLENVGFQFRQLQKIFLLGGDPPTVKETSYFDNLWQDVGGFHVALLLPVEVLLLASIADLLL